VGGVRPNGTLMKAEEQLQPITLDIWGKTDAKYSLLQPTSEYIRKTVAENLPLFIVLAVFTVEISVGYPSYIQYT
jgi:hypothetical protein